MRSCILCLERTKSFIEIFSTRGKKLKIQKILSLHFWFKFNENCKENSDVCIECWKIVKQFNDFYDKISQAHSNLKELAHVKIEKEYVHISDDEPCETIAEEIESQQVERKEFHDVKAEEFYNVNDSLKVFIEETPYGYEAPTPGNVDMLMTNVLDDDDSDDDDIQFPEEEYLSTSLEESQTTKEEKINDCSESDTDTYSDDSDYNPKDDEKKPDNTKIVSPNIRKAGRPKKKRLEGDTKKSQNRDQIRRREEEQEIRTVLKQIKCELCSQTFNTFRGCKGHYARAHNVDGYLTCCDTKYFKKKPLVIHIQSHLFPEGKDCPTCNKNFLNQYRLELHMEIHKSSEEKPFKCDKCPKTFARAEPLRLHKLRHAEKTHTCDKCPKAYPTKKMLEKHIQGVHDKAFIHICDICARVFRSKAIYEKHKILVHSDVKPDPAQCQVCGAWLKHEGSLKAHIKRHHTQEGVRHICEMCGKESPNATALYMHKKYVHWSEKIHKCTICEKAFKEEKTLREHMAALHTGEMLYSCGYCSKTCNSSATMHKHRKQQHPEEWAAEQQKKSYV